jgi:hypothetical protein
MDAFSQSSVANGTIECGRTNMNNKIGNQTDGQVQVIPCRAVSGSKLASVLTRKHGSNGYKIEVGAMMIPIKLKQLRLTTIADAPQQVFRLRA